MTDRKSVVMAVAMSLLLFAGIGATTGRSSAGGGGEEKQAGTRQAELPKPLVIPPEERNRKNPVPRTPKVLELGKSLFSSQCTMCHGPKGDGRGDLAGSLKFKMPDLTDPRVQAKRTDGDLFYILSRGHGQMPAETRLPPASRWEMIHFIRTLKRGSATR